MPLNRAHVLNCLREFDFARLFVDELGWNRHRSRLSVSIKGQVYPLEAVAEKHSFQVFVCVPLPGQGIPDDATRRRIDKEVMKSVHEHLIIFVDRDKGEQRWQWVKREAGKPAQCRTHRYHASQPGESLLQRLSGITYSLEEEEGLSLPTVTGNVRAAFDIEPVTRRFYDRFKGERDAFQAFLDGIPDGDLERWYVSVMLNRLMFIYFVQKKGFLDGNRDYLRTKLAQSRQRGAEHYYREFLCPLFFEGFAKQPGDRDPEVAARLGTVPYLNGGLFLRHQIEERHGEQIQIADAAFERLFDFFDQYQWHLDERPLRRDNEINPDVLGYIFEKYINQKQMGAYYTKEDITEYIGKSTIIPFLVDAAERGCKVAFEGESSVWRLLADDPDRYVYPAVKHGAEQPLPDYIAAGLERVPDRGRWNEAAAPELALPTEIWREVVARRRRYEEVKAKLAGGEVRSINDLITYNLDLRQFAQDVIEGCEGPDLLWAVWQAVERVTVLDPTCGSGAFLFAALNILEPLYEACLERMEFFLDEWGEAGRSQHRFYAEQFQQILGRVEQHHNPKYFILKSIVVNNLFGVDLMDEAVEICKLRLFLKLVAQVETVDQIEPLPDIDFNIRAGNTLVGFATEQDVEQALVGEGGQMPLFLTDEQQALLGRIHAAAEHVKRQMATFRRFQTEWGVEPAVFTTAKADLRAKLATLNAELDGYLASIYEVDPSDSSAYEAWRTLHQPFHWFVEFYGIMEAGGFDVIIGNPPYLESRQIGYMPLGLASAHTNAVHAMCVERCLGLGNRHCNFSMILPMAIVSTQRMVVVQEVIEAHRCAWYANFSWRPSKLFETVNRALTIVVSLPGNVREATYSTTYQKWTAETRDQLMPCLGFVSVPTVRPSFWVPKLGQQTEAGLLQSMCRIPTHTGDVLLRRWGEPIYYRNTGGLYWKVFTDFAPAFSVNGVPGCSSRQTTIGVSPGTPPEAVVAVLSSGIYWWWYTITSNCRDNNPSDITGLPVPLPALADPEVAVLGRTYLNDLVANSTTLVRQQRQTGRTETQCFTIRLSKPIIDDIDRVLARHYGFTDEELDFILNYDIKYRMGRDGGGGEDGE